MSSGFCVFCANNGYLKLGNGSGICSSCFKEPECLKLWEEVIKCK